MRKHLALSVATVALLGCTPAASPADAALIEHVDSLSKHMDRLALSFDAFVARLPAQPQQSKPTRPVCRDRHLVAALADDKKDGDVELGPLEACPAPNQDGACFKGGVAVSTMQARCEAGKLK